MKQYKKSLLSLKSFLANQEYHQLHCPFPLVTLEDTNEYGRTLYMKINNQYYTCFRYLDNLGLENCFPTVNSLRSSSQVVSTLI